VNHAKASSLFADQRGLIRKGCKEARLLSEGRGMTWKEGKGQSTASLADKTFYVFSPPAILSF
jgi:hypothetical protein